MLVPDILMEKQQLQSLWNPTTLKATSEMRILQLQRPTVTTFSRGKCGILYRKVRGKLLKRRNTGGIFYIIILIKSTLTLKVTNETRIL